MMVGHHYVDMEGGNHDSFFTNLPPLVAEANDNGKTGPHGCN